jgi:replicative DNA helicase
MKTKHEELPVLPHSREAETGVLGVILLNEKMMAVASERLRPDDFMLLENQKIFSAMLLMDRESRPIDLITVVQELEDRGELEAAGGPAYVSSLSDGIPRSTNILEYVEMVKRKSSLRKLAFEAQALQEQALDRKGHLEEILDRAESSIAAIREEAQAEDKSPVSMKEAVRGSYEMMERVVKGEHAIIGESTGYPTLDGLTAGWIPEDLVILGARPSMGKTALCLEFFRRLGKRGIPAMFFSLEMSKASLIMRLACMIGRIDSHKLRTGHCSAEDVRKIRDAMAEMSEWPNWILDPPRLYSGELLSKVRHYAERFKLKFVIVDYLQLLRARAENRTQEITAVSRDLKEAAKVLGKLSKGTLLATSQLSRMKTREPQLEDLRESGQIEQDADVVMFLWNKDKDAKNGQFDPYEKYLKIAKQRNGPTGTIPLIFLSPWTAFETPMPEEQ